MGLVFVEYFRLLLVSEDGVVFVRQDGLECNRVVAVCAVDDAYELP